jgi:hypothetical protein
MTLAVLAIDAADSRLVHEFECEELLLDEDRALVTRAYRADQPHTDEIWPMVATGQEPSEHAYYTGDGPQWQRPSVRVASQLLAPLPESWRTALGRVALGVDEGRDRLEDDVFDSVRAWPGVAHDKRIEDYKAIAREIDQYSGDEAIGLLGQFAARDLGWAAMQSGVVGVHTHALDIGGHLFANDREALRQLYEFLDGLVAVVRDLVDDVIVMSDHGMQVGWLDDPEPAAHSYHPFVAATHGVVGELPTDIEDLHGWLGRQQDAGESIPQPEQPTEQLRNLGYLA